MEVVREKGMQTLSVHQGQVKRYFDKKATFRTFKVGDLVLKWDVDRTNPGRHSKFAAIRSGPYVITGWKEANSFNLSRLNGEALPIAVNGIHLKACA